MPTSHLPRRILPSTEINQQRIFRSAVLNGVTPPAGTVAILEARGVNVGELEQRIRDTMECRR